MSRWTDDVRAFEVASGTPPPKRPGWPPAERLALSVDLVLEEVDETLDAVEARNLVEVADGIADSIWVLARLALVLGIDLDAVWAEVARSNMAKFTPCGRCGGEGVAEDRSAPVAQTLVKASFTDRGHYEMRHPRGICDGCDGTGLIAQRRADGKILKPEGWTPPDIAGVLEVDRG